MRIFFQLLILFFVTGLQHVNARQLSVKWEIQKSTLTSSLRGLCAVSENVAWVSGTMGKYAFTRDGGKSWQRGSVPGADSLDFRDVEAFANGTAYLLSAGPGGASRIYKTTDWGAAWKKQVHNQLEKAFFNAFDFRDDRNGVAAGDPIEGRIFILQTSDGGENWRRLPLDGLPKVKDGEYGFAASGSNIAVFGEKGIALASGGSVARVFRTTDRGKSWSVVASPLVSGNASSGIFSIAFKDENISMIAGGDYQKDGQLGINLARSVDGGRKWESIGGQKSVGFRSCVAWRQDAKTAMWVVVGTSGSDYSLDEGKTWIRFDEGSFNAVDFAGSAGWAAGAQGRVAKLHVQVKK